MLVPKLNIFDTSVEVKNNTKLNLFEFDLVSVKTSNKNPEPPLSIWFYNTELLEIHNIKTFKEYLKKMFNEVKQVKKGNKIVYIENNIINFEIEFKRDINIYINNIGGLESFLIPISETQCIIQSGDNMIKLDNNNIKELNKHYNKNYTIGFIEL